MTWESWEEKVKKLQNQMGKVTFLNPEFLDIWNIVFSMLVLKILIKLQLVVLIFLTLMSTLNIIFLYELEIAVRSVRVKSAK